MGVSASSTHYCRKDDRSEHKPAPTTILPFVPSSRFTPAIHRPQEKLHCRMRLSDQHTHTSLVPKNQLQDTQKNTWLHSTLRMAFLITTPLSPTVSNCTQSTTMPCNQPAISFAGGPLGVGTEGGREREREGGREGRREGARDLSTYQVLLYQVCLSLIV